MVLVSRPSTSTPFELHFLICKVEMRAAALRVGVGANGAGAGLDRAWLDRGSCHYYYLR
jgi:hypothetical protein